ncbi:hypothetical protein GCM10023196_055930 [Actinoallomurus vinaceus]|uniref:Lipoprotein LpqB beta-propeller domain-containing protein n=1 Tax=Actinoallomurus vinaceus TaxID=1080074 RepID=A0ABP8UGJ6_9ACTN
MKGLEDRIRDACAVADTWGPEEPRPLRLPVRPRLRLNVIAPLTAAAAVVLAVSLVLVILPRRSRPVPSTPATASPYLLAMSGGVLEVVDSRTGRPHGEGIDGYGPAVTRGPRPGTYLVSQPEKGLSGPTRIRTVRLTADGRTVVESAPHWSVPGLVRELALSPDGRRLAYTIRNITVVPGAPATVQPIVVGMLDLRTGARREWTLPKAQDASASKKPDAEWNWGVSWSADNATLIFTARVTGRTAQVRALDTTAPGSDLLATRVLVSGAGKIGGTLAFAVSSGDRHTVIAAVDGARSSGRAKAVLAEYVDGRFTRILATLPGCGPVHTLTSSPNGLLISRNSTRCGNGSGTLIIMSRGKVQNGYSSEEEVASAAW